VPNDERADQRQHEAQGDHDKERDQLSQRAPLEHESMLHHGDGERESVVVRQPHSAITRGRKARPALPLAALPRPRPSEFGPLGAKRG